MNTQELRLGNWVYKCYPDGKQEHQIINLSKFFVSGYGASSVEPIPLTEEWLEKLGFRKTKGKFGNDFDMIKNKYDVYLTIEHWTDPSETSEYHNFWFCKYIMKPNKLKYVHQLQNLFFALTNEELTLKSEEYESK